MRFLIAAVIVLSTGCVTVAPQQPVVLVVQQPAPSEPSPVLEEPAAMPTARCRDGAFSYSAHRSGTCSYHGGVAQWAADFQEPGWSGPVVFARVK
jgi:hypothetical protein